jgi:uncharacterized protein
MVNTEPQITNNAVQHRYEMTVDGKHAGHIQWRMHGEDTIDLVHTEVENEFEGRGLASKLAKFALDDARARGLKVVPTCTYIGGWIQKHPEYENVVARR